MDLQIENWLSLIFRWAHIVAGIGWIGSSFYFMALDFSLRRREGMDPSIKGENWSVHGGGFYHIQKYMVAPENMPDRVKWYKWESYATWLTGFALLSVLYYWQADIYLIDRSVLALTQSQAIAISIACLAASWIIYDALCKSPLKNNQVLMFAVLFVLIVAASYGLGKLFSARAAFLHVGAMIATIMSANVFFVIIPNQKIVYADLKAGSTPDGKYGTIAKLRSTHNNYLTLPVLFLMISNHYPMTFGHPMNWMVIALVLPIGAIVRSFFNAHDQGKSGFAVQWQWPSAAILLLILMVFVAWKPGAPAASTIETASGSALVVPSDAEIMQIIADRCTVCHAQSPTEFVTAPPAGMLLESIDDIHRYRAPIYAQVIDSAIMPPGNLTDMADGERAALKIWLDANSGEKVP